MFKEFYSKYANFEGSSSSGNEIQITCPFHEDTKPSLSINVETGAWRCFSPQCQGNTGGGPAHFVALIKDIPIETAMEEVDSLIPRYSNKKKKRFPHTVSEIAQWNKHLLDNKRAFRRARDSFGWKKSIIEKYMIGYYNQQYTIPIFEHGQLVNVRFYNPDGTPKITGVYDFNQVRMWPLENFKRNPIYVMEGEKDCLNALSQGLNAVTGTGGASTFKASWSKYFTGKDVVLVYDSDIAGAAAAEKALKLIKRVAKSVKNVRLDTSNIKSGDFTDYITKLNNTIEQFNKVVDSTEVAAQHEPSQYKISDDVSYASMEDIIYENMYYRRVCFKARVASKYRTPFVIPKTIRITCHQEHPNKCTSCMNNNTQGCQVITIDERQVELLTLIDCSDAQKRLAVHKIAGLKCDDFTMEVVDATFIELLFVVPVIDAQDARQGYDTRPIYMLGKDAINNEEYTFWAVPVHDPKSQHIVFIAYENEGCESSIDLFRLTPDIIKELKKWQVQETLKKNSTTSTKTSSETLLASTEDETYT